MRQVEVGLGERSYRIDIAAGLLADAGNALAPYARGGRIVVVSDDRVWAAQGHKLRASGLAVEAVIVPAGDGLDVEAVIAHVRERIADFKVPQYVATRTEPLPRNPGGKVLKAQLREETEWGDPLR